MGKEHVGVFGVFGVLVERDCGGNRYIAPTS